MAENKTITNNYEVLNDDRRGGLISAFSEELKGNLICQSSNTMAVMMNYIYSYIQIKILASAISQTFAVGNEEIISLNKKDVDYQ